MMTRTMSALAAALFAATSATAFAAGQNTQNPAPNTSPQPAASQPAESQAALPSNDHQMSARRVEEIQAALQRKGEQVATDGIWGPKTTAALRDFQKKNGLKPTGQYDQATAQKLQIPHWG